VRARAARPGLTEPDRAVPDRASARGSPPRRGEADDRTTGETLAANAQRILDDPETTAEAKAGAQAMLDLASHFSNGRGGEPEPAAVTEPPALVNGAEEPDPIAAAKAAWSKIDEAKVQPEEAAGDADFGAPAAEGPA
jgi:hypothetical protein